MYTEGFEQWFKLNKNMTGPLNELGKTATDICRRSAQQNLEIIGENLNRFSDQMKRLSNVRKPEDLINLQRECLNEDISAVMENTQKLAHNAMENYEELSRIWGSTAAKVTENAVEKAQKYTEKAEK
jgi:hypothetical protein